MVTQKILDLGAQIEGCHFARIKYYVNDIQVLIS